ncbi:MAG: thioredoxin-disulfide reductase [Candidatus Kapabacteria bacterium]|nr:thioredoxin-disulfide reductase [Candidatus Kapabacteria bacterium]MCS7169982.1 thioredoxin-disulfide reductase [Candidatus Kapabacteria bacterium]MDW7997324.1 thioredoxin-disulfide reductase [Bacteroidota bacterium]MDW8225545.1 thioredoxin-disulfide reductase [Bacteroidota bacterium]
MQTEHHEVAILGAGPAGLTAAIYAARARLDTIVFEGPQPGGQLTITTEVENYPGFEHGILGPELMDIFRRQAQRFGARSVYETIARVDFHHYPFMLWSDTGKPYSADTVIIATGASAKKLGVPGEAEYIGYGISACATCDGFFFRDRHVYVVGGGDTAMEEALFLTRFAQRVTIIHRRQEFRASKIMQERVRSNSKIDFLLDTVVEEFLGEQRDGVRRLTAIRTRNVRTGEEQLLPADGVFVAIGHQPNTDIFRGFLEMDEQGYIITQVRSTYTSIPGVFACGDVQDKVYRQAVTAAGSGCMAAMDAERWLEAFRHARGETPFVVSSPR